MKLHGALVFACAVVAGLYAAPSAQAQADEDLIAGRRLAEDMCARCHAIHAYESSSPDLNAPTFKAIANDPGNTAADLAGWLQSSHPAMQNVMVGPEDASNVIGYLLSLRQW